MKPNQMDKMLSKTKVLVTSNVIEKTKDLGVEITRAFTSTQQYSLQNKIVYSCTIIVLIYFAAMDFLTYLHLQQIPVRTEDPPAFTGGFDYFKMLSIKGMMEDQLSCHINWPTCELFEMGTHFSKAPGITANGISLFGALLSIPAAKLLSMESMLAKRIAIVIFMFRLWIDGLDGVVFRMQHLSGAQQHTQQSARHSSGWLVDFFCDLFAALMFLMGVYHSLKQGASKYSGNQITGLLPVSMNCQPASSILSSPRPSSPAIERGDKEISMRTIHVRLLWVVLTIMSASGMWDYFVQQYRDVFEVTLPTFSQQVLQNKILKSGSTFLIFWFWRILNGVSLINAAFLAAAYDRLWDYVHYLQLFGTSGLLLLAVMTLLHLNSVHGALGLYNH